MERQLIIGERLRDRGIARTEINNKAWVDRAVLAIRELAQRKGHITTDDVHAAMLTKPLEPRAMGAAMRRAQKEGIITPLNATTQSKRPECHARPIRIWRTLIQRNI